MSKSGVHPALSPLGSGLSRVLTEGQTANPRDEPPGSGVWDTARVLQISLTTVIHELKKGSALAAVNTPLLETLRPDDVGVRVNRVKPAKSMKCGVL